VEMPPQGVMTCEQASYSPGLKPIKGHKFRPGASSSLFQDLIKFTPSCPVAVI